MIKKTGKTILGVIAIFAAIQLIPIDRTNPPVDPEKDFIQVMNTPPKISGLLKRACYDCHSFETKYPRYAYVAPVSWSVKHHINEGREHANFSIWENYNQDLKKNMLEKAAQNIDSRKMPIPGYIVYHPEANLSEAERQLLINYFKELLESETY